VCTPGIRAMIRDDKVHQIYSAMQAGKKHGMQTLSDDLYRLFIGREVSLEECLRVSSDQNEFLRMIGQPVPDDDKAAGAAQQPKGPPLAAKR